MWVTLPALRRTRSVSKPLPINCKLGNWSPWTPCNSCTDKAVIILFFFFMSFSQFYSKLGCWLKWKSPKVYKRLALINRNTFKNTWNRTVFYTSYECIMLKIISTSDKSTTGGSINVDPDCTILLDVPGSFSPNTQLSQDILMIPMDTSYAAQLLIELAEIMQFERISVEWFHHHELHE